MQKLTLIVPVMLMLFATTGCKKKLGCTDSTALNYDSEVDEDDGSCVYQSQNFQLKFHHMAGQNNFEYDQIFTLGTGRNIKFSKAQFYLSGFKTTGPAATEEYGTHLLVSPNNDEDFPIGALVSSAVSGISMAIGVDSLLNHQDPATFNAENALSANQENFGHWGWDPGYKFLVMEGFIDSSAAMNGATDYPFIYHLGFDEAYKPFVIATNFSSDGSDVLVDLKVDWLAFFNEVDLPAENSSHMFTSAESVIGHKIIDQASNAITLNQ